RSNRLLDRAIKCSHVFRHQAHPRHGRRAEFWAVPAARPVDAGRIGDAGTALGADRAACGRHRPARRGPGAGVHAAPDSRCQRLAGGQADRTGGLHRSGYRRAQARPHPDGTHSGLAGGPGGIRLYRCGRAHQESHAMEQRINLQKIIDGDTTPPPGAPARSTWEIWTAAPHRVMFLFGVLQIVVTMAWWLIDLAGRYAGWYTPVAWTVPPGWAHAFLKIYTVFPLFVFGFSMTALPNWTGQRLTRAAWMRAAVPLVIGIPLVYIGFATHRLVAAVGVTLVLVAWLLVWRALLGLIWANRAKDKHAFGLLVVLGLGATGVALFGLSLYTGDWQYADISRRGGMWLFLLPLFMVVSHRLIPFFSGRVIRNYVMYRPKGSLAFLAAGAISHFVLEMNALTAWTWVVDLPMAAWVGYLAFRWGLLGSFRAKLLVMLHLALVMLAIALLLYGIASLI